MDDDAPPALQSLASQTAALTKSSAICMGSMMADVTFAQQPQPCPKNKSGRSGSLAKGFFDAPKQERSAKASQRKTGADAMPFIKARSAGLGHGPQIPEFLKVEPDPELLKYNAMKEDMLKKLKPDDATIGSVMQSETLMAGFSDPEVMAAVNDVAANPQAIAKYKNNKKVQIFYAQMAQVMSKKLENAAA